MRLVSWNVAGRQRRVHAQADRVLSVRPDLICLQEITPVAVEPWRERLDEAGFRVELAPLPRVREASRPLGVLTATRSALEVVPVADLPWPERVLAVRLDGALEVVNVHLPVSPKPGLAKVLGLQAHPGRARPPTYLRRTQHARREHADVTATRRRSPHGNGRAREAATGSIT